jgi:hypothetical protein
MNWEGEQKVQRLKRRIRMTLFLFLCSFSLVVNVMVYSILTNYNYRHYAALSQSHMEQQYQNLIQQMAVMGEGAKLSFEKPQFINAIKKGDWTTVSKKVEEFLQSSRGMVGGRIYIFRDQTLHCITSSGTADMASDELLRRLKKNNSNIYSAQWFLRTGAPDKYEYLSYLLPIYEEKNFIGFFLADIKFSQLVYDILSDNSKTFWQETLLMRTGDKIWSSATEWSGELDRLILEKNEKPTLVGNTLITVHKLEQSEDYYAQVLTLKINRIFFPLGITLMVFFVISIILSYFLVVFVTNSIILPLLDLRDKMDQTKKQY